MTGKIELWKMQGGWVPVHEQHGFILGPDAYFFKSMARVAVLWWRIRNLALRR